MLHYILGFFSGVVFLSLIIGVTLFFLSRKAEEDSRKIVLPSEEIDEEVKEIVFKYKKEYLKLDTFGFEGNFEKMKVVSLAMTKEISKKYYPESKNSCLELEFYQLLKLNITMSNFMLQLLKNSKFEKVKYAKISTLMGLNEKRLDILDTFNKIGFLNSLLKSPVGLVIGKIGINLGKEAIFEIFYKTVGNYGVEKLGRELNRLYSGHYIDKKD